MSSLCPEDVPGAVLPDDVSLESHSVLKLQRWLECRGLKKVGTKAELISRIQNCVNAGNEGNIFSGVDGGKWYDLKNNAKPGPSSNADESLFEGVVWGKFPSCNVPLYFNKGHIYTYIVGENVESDDPKILGVADQSVTTVKPFRRGHQYVSSDHISDVEDGEVNNMYLCKCKCLSSFQKTLQYSVRLILNKTSGAVMKGICECKQSALGKCSHVSAFLLFISEYVEKHGHTKLSATSQPRRWGLGSKKRNPAAVKSAVYPIKRFRSERANFDPRPEGYVKTFNENDFVTDLQKAGDSSMFQSIFYLKYEDFNYDDEEIDVLKQQSKQFMTNLHQMLKEISKGEELVEIPGTSPQGCEDWLKWRSFFITSSNAKIVATQLISDRAKKNFLLKNLWRETKGITTVAMAYGKANEVVARQEYAKILNENQSLVEKGLMLNVNHPYMATSPDGVVMIGNEIDHIIEIKCPKVLEKCRGIYNFDTHLSKSQSNSFFLEKKNNTISVKRKHPYLYQIIMTLEILQVDKCMLIVWCPADMMVIPVYRRDYPEVVREIKTNVRKFYSNIYIPEVFTMKVIRDLTPVDLGII
ncbi:uncharacterized protein LOC123307908 [Coccinella septempunctata]|uniref:uncharacterized protein LOC123307908 n=1 Tax=Coccinella septempunctata TaxID=41139 RepID=UPI001D07F53E|nr:uncharacterized protein LOC123307908 [Coccinella septempunctata]